MDSNLKELFDTYFSSLKSTLEEYCGTNNIYPWEVDVHPEIASDQSLSIQLKYNRGAGVE